MKGTPGRARADQILAVAALLLAGPALAQPSTARVYELELPALSPGGRGSVLTNGAALLPHGQLAVSLFTAYDFGPIIYRTGDARLVAPVSDRLSEHLVLAIAALPWLQLGAQVPLVFTQPGVDLSGEGIPSGDTIGLGPSTVSARFGASHEDRGQPLDLAFDVGVRLPSFPQNGPGHALPIALQAHAGVAKRAGALRLELVGGGRIEPSPSGNGVGGWLDATAAAVYAREGVGQELNVAAHVPLDGGPASVEILTGLRFALNELFQVYLLAGPGFGASPTFTFRFLSGITFGLPVLDVRERKLRSGPGLPTPTVEGAPIDLETEPEPPKVLAPNPSRQDSDQDGLPDAADLCPLEPGPPALKGCPDRDLDGDGILDSADRCPNVAGIPELLGCPKIDRDGDGLADDEDRCPDEYGPKARGGCPVKDTDEDGVVDEADGCPTEKGPIENRGCPTRDRDGDGVLDAEDNCPDQPGPASNQGCPKKVVQLVIITKEKLVIREKVLFATAKATVLPRSFGLLDQVAQVMKEHPEIAKVVVVGHTDSRGSAATNRALSQARAEAVRAHLLKRGVAPERLAAKGMGPDKPIAPNLTSVGREMNRRVEFLIADE